MLTAVAERLLFQNDGTSWDEQSCCHQTLTSPYVMTSKFCSNIFKSVFK